MEVHLISYPEESELIAKMAGVICYSGNQFLKDIKTNATKKSSKYLQKIIKSGHLSIIEHNSFVFYISGISRVCSHQLVRKRIASFSQQSQRYVNAENFNVIIPDTIKNSEFHDEYKNISESLFSFYQKMINKKIPKEDARYILPNATTTQLVVTMNAHALIEFFARRVCTRAQKEIRNLAIKMLIEVKKVAPIIFKEAGAYCEFFGYCPEGDKSCGKELTLEKLKGKKAE